ncbi:PDDEXK-like family protein [Anaerotignum sp.]|uniref:PDDEXK-like family protein n=1 Tax=Anaerotignum sp. TaxID=2039241 RepID=UPI00289BF129|nr:PD-(D/E)XK nuclease family protein [Anaerotignum sp.]
MNGKAENLTDENALQNFLVDSECLDELLPWSGKFNLFDVLKISRTEIRHSNMLSWLLNPNENHGLGDSFIKGIIQRLVEKDSDGRYDVFRTLLMDLYSFNVYREWKNIDILLISDKEKILIAIENKVGTHEHSNQLNRYLDILEKDYSGYIKIGVFLTPDGEDPSDVENWNVLTYNDIVEVLESKYNQMELQPDVSLMIKNYIDVVRRDIVQDQKLIDICNKIYNKHRRALDLIYEHRTDGKTQVADAIKNQLRLLTESGKIRFSQEWSTGSMLVFHTNSMDEYLKPLNAKNSSWSTTYIYHYWILLEDRRYCVIFELGGWNVPDEEMMKMKKIINKLKPNDKKKEDFRYKKVYRSKWYNVDDSDNLEDDVAKSVQAAVNELLQKESDLLSVVK